MKRVLATASVALVMLVAPVAASAVYVSSSEGAGYQYRDVTYQNGASTTGSLKSLKGYNVYYQGRVNYPQWYCGAVNIGRYTSNTSSSSYVSRGGVITDATLACSGPDVHSRVARDISFSPDPVGSWSSGF